MVLVMGGYWGWGWGSRGGSRRGVPGVVLYTYIYIYI